MYLSYLQPELKESFLDLSLIVSNADYEFNASEKNLIEQLCEEMCIKPRFSSEKSLESVLADIQATATKREKKIILLELLGIVMVDSNIRLEELDVVKALMERFKLGQAELEEATALVKQIYNVYSECAKFINA